MSVKHEAAVCDCIQDNKEEMHKTLKIQGSLYLSGDTMIQEEKASNCEIAHISNQEKDVSLLLLLTRPFYQKKVQKHGSYL